MKSVALIFGMILSVSTWAQNGAAYKNLSYISLNTLRESCPAPMPNPHREKIECLGFKYSIRTAREAGSGIAEGKRSSAQMNVRPQFEPLAQKIAALLKAGQNAVAQRAWREYIKRLARVNKPVDLNDEIAWIAKEAFYKNDPELDFRLKEFAATSEAQGLASDRIAENQRLLGQCSQVPNCPAHDIQESLGQLQQALDHTMKENEIAMIKLQSAISARGQLIQLISNMLNAFDETTKSVIGNIDGGCGSEPCR